ncbi:glycerol-3-phosphate dehydrogenase [Actinopolyspora biskrensis]|uniref:Glycerol-3-phosphate dehydrogenase n=1 Tax=Actinopolyspora biskrensis TaxID=1470178 RepID=A0A852YYY3_9ACTN|nr:hypothetical protein [Actinopolyspora biskrensis]NYH80284.1 glycerol-3-phosphate dehydrogenase [Actinopolyspora biskrensis]
MSITSWSAVRHEGALDVDDLLDRRTRVGVVARDREAALPAGREALGGERSTRRTCPG